MGTRGKGLSDFVKQITLHQNIKPGTFKQYAQNLQPFLKIGLLWLLCCKIEWHDPFFVVLFVILAEGIKGKKKKKVLKKK